MIKFKISDNQYIKAHFEEFNELDFDSACIPCFQVDVDYVDEKNNICKTFGYENISDFYYFFIKSKHPQKLLKGQMILPKEIKDLGYVINQDFAEKEESDDWTDYLVFSNSHKKIRPYYNSWMYNDEAGNIIFEITPFYPWFYVTKKTNPEKISYKEWIKNYKPAVKTIIPKENLKQWIKQADEFGKKYKLKFE